jgi:hypothetical protein
MQATTSIPDEFVGGGVAAFLGFILIRVVTPYAMKMLEKKDAALDSYHERDLKEMERLRTDILKLYEEITDLRAANSHLEAENAVLKATNHTPEP